MALLDAVEDSRTAVKVIDFWQNEVIEVLPSHLARYNDSRE